MTITDEELNDIINKSVDELDREMVGKALLLLSKSFDAVQILTTRQTGKITVYNFDGFGNMFARQGMAEHWLEEIKSAAVEAKRDE